jgi:hypothetical protein
MKTDENFINQKFEMQKDNLAHGDTMILIRGIGDTGIGRTIEKVEFIISE